MGEAEAEPFYGYAAGVVPYVHQAGIVAPTGLGHAVAVTGYGHVTHIQRRCLHKRRRCPGSLLGGERVGECHMTRTSVTNKLSLWKKKKKKKKKVLALIPL